MESDPRLYCESLFVARGLENWNCSFSSSKRIVVEERDTRVLEYNSVQRSTTERVVSRRMRMRTRMERVLYRRLIVSYCNWLWLREIVKEGVNKSNYPIQIAILSVTEPRTRDNNMNRLQCTHRARLCTKWLKLKQRVVTIYKYHGTGVTELQRFGDWAASWVQGSCAAQHTRKFSVVNSYGRRFIDEWAFENIFLQLAEVLYTYF
jgi:hypothetical protein